MPLSLRTAAYAELEVCPPSTSHSSSCTRLEAALQVKMVMELRGARLGWGPMNTLLGSGGRQNDIATAASSYLSGPDAT